MVKAEPVFGVGIGRFYGLSGNYTLRAHTMPLENAHNNFLQVLAELGIPGLALFLSVTGLAIRQGLRSARDLPVVAGVVAGVCAYLLTCIAGHPLLVDAAAFPFWIALSLAATPAAVAAAGSRRSTFALVAIVVVIAASLPFRLARAEDHANLEGVSAGFSLWQRESDGSRYRWAGGRASFFVPSGATAMAIPLRAGRAASSPLEVRIVVAGQQAERMALQPGGGWTTVRVPLPGRTSARFTRIEIEVSLEGVPRPADAKTGEASGVLMVGRPEYEYPPGVSR